MDINKFLYNTVLSQVLSKCGNYLFAGNNFGDIFVFSIPQISGSATEEGSSSKIDSRNLFEPIQIYNFSENKQVQSLSFHRDFLIIGTTGSVNGVTWSGDRLTKKSWEVKIPSSTGLDFADVNFMWLDKTDEHLYACGDSVIYCINLDNGQIVRNFSEHKDYIHCIDGLDNNLYSASEDGSIHIWDKRQKVPSHILEPYKNKKLDRPHFGKWQGTVTATNDWLVCGGGPKPSLWHLRSLECTTIFPFPDKVHVSSVIDDTILIAGHYNNLYQFTFNGDVTAEIPVSSTAVYSAVWQAEPYKIMTIAGASNEIDVCTNFNYKDIVLKMYKLNVQDK